MNGFSGFFVRNWQFTLIMFAMLAVVGVNAVMTIPRAEDPSFPIPYVIVTAVLPGADPKDMEKLVADPIERAIDQQLDDIKEIRTTIRDGVAVMLFEFLWETDPEKKIR